MLLAFCFDGTRSADEKLPISSVGGYSGGHSEDPKYRETVARWFQYGFTWNKSLSLRIKNSKAQKLTLCGDSLR